MQNFLVKGWVDDFRLSRVCASAAGGEGLSACQQQLKVVRAFFNLYLLACPVLSAHLLPELFQRLRGQARAHASTTSFSFLLSGRGAAPSGVSAASLALWYLMAFRWSRRRAQEMPWLAQRAWQTRAGASRHAGGFRGCCA